MKPNNHFLFLGRESVMIEIRPQVISPPESATLPASSKSCKTCPFMESCLTGKSKIITRLIIIQIISAICIYINLLSSEQKSNFLYHAWPHEQAFLHLPLQSKDPFSQSICHSKEVSPSYLFMQSHKSKDESRYNCDVTWNFLQKNASPPCILRGWDEEECGFKGTTSVEARKAWSCSHLTKFRDVKHLGMIWKK